MNTKPFDDSFFRSFMGLKDDDKYQEFKRKFPSEEEYQLFVRIKEEEEDRRLRFEEYGPVERFYDTLSTDEYRQYKLMQRFNYDSQRIQEYEDYIIERNAENAMKNIEET